MEYKVEFKKKANKTWKMWDIVGVPGTDNKNMVINILKTTIDLSNTLEWEDNNYEWRAIVLNNQDTSEDKELKIK